MRHIVSIDDVPREELKKIFQRATELKGGVMPELPTRRKKMLNLFYQPSTRTRLSFDSAAIDLGWHVMDTENAKEFSSAIKGESLTDTIRVASGYCHIIVLRHDETGSAAKAARVSRVPVINAGDGEGEHPTQAFLDLFTIAQRYPTNRYGLTITFVGDLRRGRTVHSLARLLARFHNTDLGFASRLNFVAPKGYELPKYLIEEVVHAEMRVSTFDELSPAVLEASDVVYMTRPQTKKDEAPELGRELAATYALRPELLCHLKPDASILHPLPRTNELPECDEIDHHPAAYFIPQAWNGVQVRTALLEWVAEQL